MGIALGALYALSAPVRQNASFLFVATGFTARGTEYQTLIDFEIKHLERRPEFKDHELFLDESLRDKLNREALAVEIERINREVPAEKRDRAISEARDRYKTGRNVRVADVLKIATSAKGVALDEDESKRLAAALHIENQDGRRSEKFKSDGEAVQQLALKALMEGPLAGAADKPAQLSPEVSSALLPQINKMKARNGESPITAAQIKNSDIQKLLLDPQFDKSVLGDKKTGLGLSLLGDLRGTKGGYGPDFAGEGRDYDIADGYLPSPTKSAGGSDSSVPEPSEAKDRKPLAKSPDSMKELNKGPGDSAKEFGKGSGKPGAMPVKPAGQMAANDAVQPDMGSGGGAPEAVTPVPSGGFNVAPGAGLLPGGASPSGGGDSGPVGRHCKLDPSSLDELREAEQEFRRANGIPAGAPLSVPAQIIYTDGSEAKCHLFGVQGEADNVVNLGLATHCVKNANGAVATDIKIGSRGEFGSWKVGGGTPKAGELSAAIMDRSDMAMLRTVNDPTFAKRLAGIAKVPMASTDAASGSAVMTEAGRGMYGCIAQEENAGQRNFAYMDFRFAVNKAVAGIFPGHSGSIVTAVVNGRFSVVGTLSAKATSSNAQHKVGYATTQRARGQAATLVGIPKAPPTAVVTGDKPTTPPGQHRI